MPDGLQTPSSVSDDREMDEMDLTNEIIKEAAFLGLGCGLILGLLMGGLMLYTRKPK
ncbi:OLC1v1032197C1 [Oldenlandia corymbosa var. corymbosa]|uniref:OLC1v1032197C1 n=1 Tax=Oldenlandia corymbosa var. corymbosa TaxID=529605 RepID=A0AAV1CNA6_OLDCO|nr:OLC1v1032197C1 [Oldenlandia corymbosa var. corymbosa]